jgi:hypothetical protein
VGGERGTGQWALSSGGSPTTFCSDLSRPAGDLQGKRREKKIFAKPCGGMGSCGEEENGGDLRVGGGKSLDFDMRFVFLCLVPTTLGKSWSLDWGERIHS